MKFLVNYFFKFLYNNCEKINNIYKFYKNYINTINSAEFINIFHINKFIHNLYNFSCNTTNRENNDIDCISTLNKLFEGYNKPINFNNFYYNVNILNSIYTYKDDTYIIKGINFKKIKKYINIFSINFYNRGLILCPITFNSNLDINNYIYNIYMYLNNKSKNIYKSCFVSLFYYYFGLLFSLLNVYKSNDINVLNSNILVIVFKLSSFTITLDMFNRINYIFPIKFINIINNALYLSNIVICDYRPYLIGLVRYTLYTNNVLAKLSFQETLKTLKNLILEHKVNWNVDSKSNIILSNFLPIGSGWYRYFINK